MTRGKTKDKNAPKRPLTSFLIYGNYLRETREEIKNLPIKDQAIEIGKAWKELDEKTKAEFNEKAKKFKEEYDVRRAEYEKSDSHKKYQAFMKEETKDGKKEGKEGCPY